MAASTLAITGATTNRWRLHHNHQSLPLNYSPTYTRTNQITFSTSTANPRRPFQFPSDSHPSRCCRCRAASPRPPPPDSDQRSRKTPAPSLGIAASLTRFQDTVQIFFAVLFWMSLFFWSAAWDGKNNGRPNKGSRFRK